MKLNRLIVGLFVLLMIPSEAFSQKWLKKIEKALETVDKVLDTGSSDSKSDSKAVNEGKSVVAKIGDDGRGGTFKMTTHHPDFKVKVKRCEVSGKTCVIDMLFENVGSEDVTITAGQLLGAIAYDDEANQYVLTQNDNTIKISLGKTADWAWCDNITLMQEVPIKVRVQIENVSSAATMFRRLQINIESHAWSLNGSKPLTFYNLPISREGDE